MRERRPKKEIEDVLREAERAGWRIIRSPRGHAWGFMLCPNRSRDGCRRAIFSTPKNAQNHAKRLQDYARRCTHAKGDGERE